MVLWVKSTKKKVVISILLTQQSHIFGTEQEITYNEIVWEYIVQTTILTQNFILTRTNILFERLIQMESHLKGRLPTRREVIRSISRGGRRNDMI